MVSTLFDANCWCERVDEEIAGTAGRATQAFSKAENEGKIVIDEDGFVKHQYCEARRGFGERLFDQIFEAYTLKGKILISPTGRNQSITKALRSAGVPNGEHPYFHAAHNISASFLVSEDIDFFDPTLKKAALKARQRAKSKRNGCACKLARSFGCEVYCIDGYIAA